MNTTDPDLVAARTRHWLEQAVIGLNLCPFARAPYQRGQVRLVVSDARDIAALHATLEEELRHLAEADEDKLETTLLIHPGVLQDFLDFNDFLDIAEQTLQALDLEGVLQIASFHPDYQFADTEPDDITNATNRSPYPTLHLLRESSIERAAATIEDPARIYDANMARLRELGEAGWQRLMTPGKDDAA